VQCAFRNGADEIPSVFAAGQMVIEGGDRIGCRVGSYLESLDAMCLTFQSGFGFGDATGLSFGAAYSNARLNNQATFNLVGDKSRSHCEVTRATIEFVETKSCGFWQ
jgi:hypothetical protein